MANLRANNIVGVGSTNAGVVFNGVTKIKTQNYFYPQTGNTSDRNVGIATESGAMRFNSDSQKLEYYDGAQWLQVSTFSPNLNGGARGVFIGGSTSINTIDYINIASTGNAVNFGNISGGPRDQSPCGATASSTRGLLMGGAGVNVNGNVIDYLTISSTGNTQDFGDLHTSTFRGSACASSTRALYAGGYQYPAPGAAINNIQYVTIASQGVNGQDFGDLTSPRAQSGSFSSPTRGVWGGGYGSAPTYTRVNIIDFATISTLGNAFDFGDLPRIGYGIAGGSNATRGIFAGAQTPTSPGNTFVNNIDYVTIATTGNSITFGELTRAHARVSATFSSIRGVFGGGYTPGTNYNIIDYVTIVTQGNATDFGDLTSAKSNSSGCSNAHGGL